MDSTHRCDKCGAQAYVRVMFKTGDLLFCSHHYDKFYTSFAGDFFVMDDEREKLLARNDSYS